MNTQMISKIVVSSVAIASLALAPSCSVLDPDYAAYKKNQQAEATANQYGVPAAGGNNNYAVPGANGETGAPYQPIPGVPDTPPVTANPTTKPYNPLPPALKPSGQASTHSVVKGDTIWGLTKKYGVTSDALRQANNLTTDVIWVGQKLIIPAR